MSPHSAECVWQVCYNEADQQCRAVFADAALAFGFAKIRAGRNGGRTGQHQGRHRQDQHWKLNRGMNRSHDKWKDNSSQHGSRYLRWNLSNQRPQGRPKTGYHDEQAGDHKGTNSEVKTQPKSSTRC